MTGSLKVVAKYGTPEEAHLMRNRLEAAGIPVFLEGEAMAAMAWHFANALGGVKVLVPEEYLFAAEEVLGGEEGEKEEERGESETARLAAAGEGPASRRAPATWTCPNCREPVEAGMDVCWACGTAADGTPPPELEGDATQEEESKERRAWAPEIALFIVLFPPTFAFFLFTKLCSVLGLLVPDAKHHLPAGDEHEEQPSAPGDQEIDALVVRAWRAAVMGFFMLPPLLMTLYSAWLLMKYWLRPHSANRRRDRWALGALAVNLLAALCLGFFLGWAVIDFFDRRMQAPVEVGPVNEERLPQPGAGF